MVLRGFELKTSWIQSQGLYQLIYPSGFGCYFFFLIRWSNTIICGIYLIPFSQLWKLQFDIELLLLGCCSRDLNHLMVGAVWLQWDERYADYLFLVLFCVADLILLKLAIHLFFSLNWTCDRVGFVRFWFDLILVSNLDIWCCFWLLFSVLPFCLAARVWLYI